MISVSFNELNLLKQIMDSTMDAIVKRSSADPSYGWINLKLDAIDGSDHFNDTGIRGKKHIYTWIQGRGLEAICTHISWYGMFNGYHIPDTASLRTLADSVASNLKKSLDFHHGHLPFDIDPDGRSDYKTNGMWTMSDLFCSRGLYAYGMMFGNDEQKRFGRCYLDQTIDAILADRFYNDQLSFDSSQYRAYDDGRSSYAGQMLALGGIVLKMKLEKDPEAPEQGRKLIEYVFSHHCNRNGRWKGIAKDTIVEWIGTDGNPSRNEDERMLLDPGHALEFVGLSTQMIDVLEKQYELYSDDRKWIEGIKAIMPSVLKANFRHGFRKPGGIAKGVDAETNEVLVSSMPWWAVPETMRALVLTEKLCSSDAFTSWAQRQYLRCLKAFKKYYFDASPSPIAVQTIDTEGKAVAVIPATPDLDPGYHTGLSFMTCYDALSIGFPMNMQKSEVGINPQKPCLLSGHVARDKACDGILDPISARILVLRSAYSQVALLSLDLLELDKTWVIEIQKRLSPVIDVEPSSILVCSTHTHTAPAAIDLGILKANKAYLRFASSQIAKAARSAMKMKAMPVQAFYAETMTSFGVNRRYHDPCTGKISMRPNPEGSIDASLPVIAFKSEDGGYAAIIFNCSVHPTTLGVDVHKVSADYPGRITSCLKDEFGQDLMGFPITGACGDTRPALLTGDKEHFRDGDEADLARIGKQTGQAIIKALQTARKLNENCASAFQDSVRFQMSDVPDRQWLETYLSENSSNLSKALKAEARLSEFARCHDNPVWDVKAGRSWAKDLLKRDSIADAVTETVSIVNICGIMMFCVPGELFSDVGMKIKGLAKESRAMIAGYCGGSVGYLPSSSAMNQGGYEVLGAYKYYYLPGPFTSDLESTLIASMEHLCKESKDNDSYRQLHI
ncbi:MAG: hypothetical protein PHT39_04775 [Sphaerochaetaceae bacterium]|jgi:hypothetical protein|nr:hypothetical protein [Sphaerochaetaceae bacterium]MDD4396871.1 hypothetical protein [Sphaerochaetaceae bacterium]